LIDVFGVCRPPGFRVTELVTPVKPFEAMYFGVPTVVSNLPALMEIVKHEVTGMNFVAGDVNSLADNIERLIDDEELRNRLSSNAIQWIEEERLWKKVVNYSINGYRELLGFDRT
jgi:glycosyltransferase involved in cell wall biosynthesis